MYVKNHKSRLFINLKVVKDIKFRPLVELFASYLVGVMLLRRVLHGFGRLRHGLLLLVRHQQRAQVACVASARKQLPKTRNVNN